MAEGQARRLRVLLSRLDDISALFPDPWRRRWIASNVLPFARPRKGSA